MSFRRNVERILEPNYVPRNRRHRGVDFAELREIAIDVLTCAGWIMAGKSGRGSLRFDKGERRACVAQLKVTFRRRIMGRGNRPQDWREERIIDIRSTDEIRKESTR